MILAFLSQVLSPRKMLGTLFPIKQKADLSISGCISFEDVIPGVDPYSW
jgi:hypothetical protein